MNPCMWLGSRLGLQVKRCNPSADVFVSLLKSMEPVVNALYAANCKGGSSGEDQSPQEAPKSVLPVKENGVLGESLMLVLRKTAHRK